MLFPSDAVSVYVGLSPGVTPTGEGHTVAETAMFVKGEDEEGFVPLRGVSDGFLDALDKGLS
jgi:hypothetical protein